MADKQVIIEVQYDTDSAIKSINKLSDEIASLEKEQESLKKAFKDGVITQEQYGQALSENQSKISKGKSERNAYIKQIQSEKGSVNALEAEIKRLVIERNKLDQSSKTGRAQAEQYNKKIGEMQKALKGAKSGTGEATGAFGKFKESLSGLPGPIGGVVNGIGGMTKATLKFIATPIGALIAAIVIVLKALIDAFKRSEDRMNKLKVVTSSISGVFKAMAKALEPVVDFIINNVVVAFEKLGNAVDKAMTFVQKALRKVGWDKAADAVEKYVKKIEEGVKSARELAEMEIALQKAQREAQKIQLDYQKQAEKLRQIRDDESKAIDERIDSNMRLGKVLRTQLNEELKIAKLALDVANKRIEVDGATTANLDERAEALTRISDIEERITGQESEQLVNINSLLRERNELYQKQIDLLGKRAEESLKGWKIEDENLKKELEGNDLIFNKKLEQINKEREERKRLIEETLESIDRITEASGAMYSARLDVANKFGKLIIAEEKDKADAIAGLTRALTSIFTEGYKKQLSDLQTQKAAELQIAGDSTTAREAIEQKYNQKEAEIKKRQFDDEKKKAIIDSLIQTAVAIVKSLPNIPLSILVGGLGLVQTGIIKKQKYQPETYAQGGKMTLFGGRPHSRGGTHLFGTDGTHLEVEKGESAFVLKKNATAEIAALSQINQSFGGRAMTTKSSFMQDGGQAQGTPVFSAEDVANAFKNVTIITKVSDVKTGLSKYDKIINNAVI